MQGDAPNFVSGIDPKAFEVPKADYYQSQLKSAFDQAGQTQFDWAKVNEFLDLLGQYGDKAGARAKGEGLTGAAHVQYGQDRLGAAVSDPASLGKALMALGSRGSASQASQAAQAQHQQQMQAAQQAAALKSAQADARMNIYKQELVLENQKFQMQKAAKQTSNGLELLQLQLQNTFNGLVANASNTSQLAELATKRANFNEIMSYIGAGVQAGALVGAGAAQMASGPAGSSMSSDGNTALQYMSGGGTTGQPATYGGLVSSTNYGYHNDTPNSSTPASVSQDFYRPAGNI